jgi:hypothetical protein
MIDMIEIQHCDVALSGGRRLFAFGKKITKKDSTSEKDVKTTNDYDKYKIK